jgi:hypothetical protein
MSEIFESSVDIHRGDQQWSGDWPEGDIYVDTEPPADVLSVQDAEGDIWSREGDRWFCSFQPSRVAFDCDGSTPNDLRVYREWFELSQYGPFTEAV